MSREFLTGVGVDYRGLSHHLRLGVGPTVGAESLLIWIPV